MTTFCYNIASGSEANMTTPCEMEFFNFLWLIWDHYTRLGPTLKNSIAHGVVIFASEPDAMLNTSS